MLFVAEYEVAWDALETVVAKRLEWEQLKPEGFSYVGEYIWQDKSPPFRGVAIIEATDVEVLNAFVLHYGPSVAMRIHPASDLTTGLRQAREVGLTGEPDGGRPARAARKKRRA